MSGPSDGGALAGTTAVVTGASGGIGRAVALRLAGAGATVLLVARSADSLEAVARELGADRARSCPADVATEDGVQAVASAAADLGSEVGVVVHAAGAFALAPLARTSVASFDEMIGVNLRAAFLLVRAFVPVMLERGHGDFVTIGSIAGRQAFPANGAYSASKFGVRGMHAVLDAELRGTGVRASFVEPAATDTPLWHAIDREQNPGLPEPAAMLKPDAVAEAVLHAVTRPRGTTTPNIIVERA
jgi:NADP-dependent 3-hydroxy acid dehydrogenase YdfG